MRWNVNMTEKWAEAVRVAIKSAFAVNIAMFAVFSVWFTALVLWRVHQYLWKCLFGHPWG